MARQNLCVYGQNGRFYGRQLSGWRGNDGEIHPCACASACADAHAAICTKFRRRRKPKIDLPGNWDSLLHQANVLGQIFSPLTKLLENKVSCKLQSRSETSSRGYLWNKIMAHPSSTPIRLMTSSTYEKMAILHPLVWKWLWNARPRMHK